VQVDPTKPKLKPPRTKRLKLKFEVFLSSSAFKFYLRRYTSEADKMASMAGAYTRSRFSST